MKIRTLLKQWDIGDIDTLVPTSSHATRTWYVTTTSGREFVLKASDMPRATREYQVARCLATTPIPVAVPLMTTAGDWYVADEANVYCLCPRLPGCVIVEHYGDDAENEAYVLGRAIGLLHTGLQRCELDLPDRDLALLSQIEDWALTQIRQADTLLDVATIERIWQDAVSALKSCYTELPHHLIHRDPHPSNILFSNGWLAGWLDFEMVQRGPRIFDVCYCGSSILLDGFADAAQARHWPTMFRALVRGYEEYFPLIASERDAIYGIFVAIELIFVAFWAGRHNAEAAKLNVDLLRWVATNRAVFST